MKDACKKIIQVKNFAGKYPGKNDTGKKKMHIKRKEAGNKDAVKIRRR